MLETLFSRFDFSAPNQNWQALAAALVIWVAVLLCTLASIRSRDLPAADRRFWSLIVTLVPLLGVLAYLPFSLRRDSVPFIPLLRQHLKSR